MYISQTPLAILLATYNSSKFLTEQLDSLYSQTNLDWTIFVRDDGSRDNTLLILESYQQKYGNIVIIEDGKGGLGAKYNFMALLDAVDSKYYMFCDHDDVWLPNKIELTMNAICDAEINNPKTPIVVHTDLKIVDSELNVINESMWKYSRMKPEILKKKNYSMVGYFMTGCTMGFNHLTKTELAPGMPPEATMHDWWIAINAIYNSGIIVSINESTILYRIHSSQAASIEHVNCKTYLTKLLNYKATFGTYFNKLLPLLKIVGYGSIWKFFLFKGIYTIRRNF